MAHVLGFSEGVSGFIAMFRGETIDAHPLRWRLEVIDRQRLPQTDFKVVSCVILGILLLFLLLALAELLRQVHDLFRLAATQHVLYDRLVLRIVFDVDARNAELLLPRVLTGRDLLLILGLRSRLLALQYVLGNEHRSTLRLVNCVAASVVVWAVDELALVTQVGQVPEAKPTVVASSYSVVYCYSVLKDVAEFARDEHLAASVR